MTTNADLARILGAIAQQMTFQGENGFKIKAYRKAAQTILTWPENLEAYVAEGGKLSEIPGIGKGLSAVLLEVLETGQSAQLEALAAEADPGVAELAQFPDLDIKKVHRVYKKLKINSLTELREALDSGTLITAMGPKVDLEFRNALFGRERILLYKAIPLAEAIADLIRKVKGVERAEVAGSIRRRRETVGSVRILAITTDFAILVEKMSKFGVIGELMRADDDSATFKLSNGLACIVQRSTTKSWGVDLVMLTGAKAHIAQLESHIKSAPEKKRETTTEDLVYETLGLSPIPPELREGTGELKLAAKHKIPRLIELGDMRGDLHMHTTASDGAESIETMAKAARKKGYDYIAISDHSQSLRITNGLTSERLRQHIIDIRAVSDAMDDFEIFSSSEVDILGEGALDYPDDVLSELDFATCSIHSKFSKNKEEQTARVLEAMSNRYFSVMGHPTGRLLQSRPGYELDIEAVLKTAAKHSVVMEINASPDRLDLSEINARRARDLGAMISVSTDSHALKELDYMELGVFQARRAGLTKEEVLNTRSAKEVRGILRARRRKE